VSLAVTVMPQLGDCHNVNFRVQGAMRSYAVGLAEGNRLVLYKNENGVYRELVSAPYPWEPGGAYRLEVRAAGKAMEVSAGGAAVIRYSDGDKPYLKGQVGVSTFHGSHCHYRDFNIRGL
jgi:hypothetical protein